MYIPMNYDRINLSTGLYSPSSYKSKNNRSFDFWFRALFQRASYPIEIGFPKNIDNKAIDFIKFCLYKYGFMMVSTLPEYGYFIQPATLVGCDFYYQPTHATLTNPALKGSKTFEIGKECEILKLTPDYMGVFDIIEYFAEKMSSLDNAINSSLVNSKYPYILGAKNKAAKGALQTIMDLVNQGEPAIFYDNRIRNDEDPADTPFQYLDLKVKDRYLTDKLLIDFETILREFDKEIGIPTVPYQKKERMVTSEADSTAIESQARISVWMECLENSIKTIKELYPDIELSAELRKVDILGGEENDSKDNIDRNVELSEERLQ